MSHIIAVANQKGGVGKTTTAVNVAAALAEDGAKVLLIDLDPQGNATVACGVDKENTTCSVLNLMLGTHRPEDVALFCEGAQLYLLPTLPTKESLTSLQDVLLSKNMRHSILKRSLKGWIDQFDWVIIDCPPTSDIFTINAMVLANYVLVPLQCEYFALEGISALLDTIKEQQQKTNPSLRVLGFVRTMYDGRSSLMKEVSESLEKFFKHLVFQTVVPRNIRLAEAPSYGMTIFQLEEKSKGAQAYRKIATEIKQKLSI